MRSRALFSCRCKAELSAGPDIFLILRSTRGSLNSFHLFMQLMTIIIWYGVQTVHLLFITISLYFYPWALCHSFIIPGAIFICVCDWWDWCNITGQVQYGLHVTIYDNLKGKFYVCYSLDCLLFLCVSCFVIYVFEGRIDVIGRWVALCPRQVSLQWTVKFILILTYSNNKM